MDNRILIGTVTAALIGFLVLPALAVNLWQLIRYLDLSRVKGPAKGIALAAWIVSFVVWWTGPLILIGAPIAIVLSIIQRRASLESSRLAANMAIFNGVFILGYVAAIVLPILWAVRII
ncbi:MAG TPA: hypothetical protein VK797_06360 [Tepidisphaeraceae bacterium]|jgi:hypothetical protein|nr:hypothetical protein [Tepidisphaeraceae bacterium]